MAKQADAVALTGRQRRALSKLIGDLSGALIYFTLYSLAIRTDKYKVSEENLKFMSTQMRQVFAKGSLTLAELSSWFLITPDDMRKESSFLRKVEAANEEMRFDIDTAGLDDAAEQPSGLN
jgi:hypothetical protein